MVDKPQVTVTNNLLYENSEAFPMVILQTNRWYKKDYKCYSKFYLQMSELVFLESSHAFVNQLLDLDNELKAKICDKDKSADQIYQTYLERLSLYEKASILLLSESDKILLQDNKEDLFVEFKMFEFKQEMKKQLDDIQTQLNDLEKNL